jgi:endonuclease-8
VPEGDTIHLAARRMQQALGGRTIERAEAPNPRSPLHRRAGELAGRTLESVEARGKHLLAHFSGDLVLHSHLGMNGRLRIFADGRRPHGKPWLVLAAGPGVAFQTQGKLLRLVSESKLRRDPALVRLGPDPLADGFRPEDGIRALRQRSDRERQLGDALLDQAVIAGIGNRYKAEGCFAARVSPWRRLADLSDTELRAVVLETASLMRAGVETGRQPADVYRREGRPCPRCGEPIVSRGQGDANRTTYWCTGCQQ